MQLHLSGFSGYPLHFDYLPINIRWSFWQGLYSENRQQLVNVFAGFFVAQYNHDFLRAPGSSD